MRNPWVYGLDGTISFTVDGDEHAVGPGNTLFIERGLVHGFANLSNADATCLAALTPGVLGPEYFRDWRRWWPRVRRPQPRCVTLCCGTGWCRQDRSTTSGLMIYELRTYDVKIGRLADYLAIFETKGFPVLSRYAEPIGFWLSGALETGKIDQVNHIWGYKSVAGRNEQRAALLEDPAWIRDLVPAVSDTFVRLQGQLMTLDPASKEGLSSALARDVPRGAVVASMAEPGAPSLAGAGFARWRMITGQVGRTFTLG